MKVATIVEGEGEVAALPVLLRRVAAWRTPGRFFDILPPIRVHRDQFLLREHEFRRYLELAAVKSGNGGWVLILLDADDDCPKELAHSIVVRAKSTVPHRSVSAVVANREFEAWFIAAASSLNGHRGLVLDPERAVEAETPRDAKGWLRAQLTSGTYGETTDQAAFSALMDLSKAYEGSRSFRKLCTEWDKRCSH
jgi:hypothetical protein